MPIGYIRIYMQHTIAFAAQRDRIGRRLAVGEVVDGLDAEVLLVLADLLGERRGSGESEDKECGGNPGESPGHFNVSLYECNCMLHIYSDIAYRHMPIQCN